MLSITNSNVMIVNSNPTAKLTQRYLHSATSSHGDSMKKLALGSRINNAKDDAAGLQISNRLQVQRSGFEVAIRNASDATSILQTAEGAMAEYTNNLMSMRDLTLQYANGVNSPDDHEAIRQEFNALKDELNRIAETTSFGGQKLLNGKNRERSFQIGANAGEAINIQFPVLFSQEAQEVEDVIKEIRWGFYTPGWRSSPGDALRFDDQTNRTSDTVILEIKPGSSMEEVTDQINDNLGDKVRAYTESFHSWDGLSGSFHRLAYYSVGNDSWSYVRGTSNGGLGVSWIDLAHTDTINIEEPTSEIPLSLPSLDGEADAGGVIDRLDEILQFVDSERAKLGAAQNRLSHAINNLSQTSENVAVSNSHIRDTNFARETSRLAKESILKEANTAMLVQASKTPQEALNLLK